MTLGGWFKEYVFYRILRMPLYSKLQKALKDKCGKKRGKQFATFIAMFVLWLIIGLWHGGNMTFVIGSGLLHWFYIVMEELLEPVFSRLWAKKNIDVKAKWLEIIGTVRTFVLVNIGNAFFRAASVPAAFALLGYGFSIHALKQFVSGGVFELGLSWIDCGIVVISLMILLIVSSLQYRIENKNLKCMQTEAGGNIACVRDLILLCPAYVRFIIWFAFVFYVIILGQYGPGYSAAEFIYQGF